MEFASPSPASALATAHKAEILSFAATHLKTPAEKLQLLADDAFEMHQEPNVYGFMILHEGGMLGVRAKLENGRLQDLGAMEV